MYMGLSFRITFLAFLHLCLRCNAKEPFTMRHNDFLKILVELGTVDHIVFLSYEVSKLTTAVKLSM